MHTPRQQRVCRTLCKNSQSSHSLASRIEFGSFVFQMMRQLHAAIINKHTRTCAHTSTVVHAVEDSCCAHVRA